MRELRCSTSTTIHDTPPEAVQPLAYSIPEACRLIEVGRTKIYDMMDCGELPYCEGIGGRRKILHSDLVVFYTQDVLCVRLCRKILTIVPLSSIALPVLETRQLAERLIDQLRQVEAPSLALEVTRSAVEALVNATRTRTDQDAS